MIKPEELRVGNWVMLNKGEKDQTEVQIDVITIYNDDYSILLKKCHPIQITQKWLTRFRFKDNILHLHKFSEWLGKDKQLYIKVTVNNKLVALLTEDNGKLKEYIPMPARSVHELQNLYFALTGEELTIKQEALS